MEKICFAISNFRNKNTSIQKDMGESFMYLFANKTIFLVSIHLRLHFETSWEVGERLLKKETNLNLFTICFLFANELKQTLNNA